MSFQLVVELHWCVRRWGFLSSTGDSGVTSTTVVWVRVNLASLTLQSLFSGYLTSLNRGLLLTDRDSAEEGSSGKQVLNLCNANHCNGFSYLSLLPNALRINSPVYTFVFMLSTYVLCVHESICTGIYLYAGEGVRFQSQILNSVTRLQNAAEHIKFSFQRQGTNSNLKMSVSHWFSAKFFVRIYLAGRLRQELLPVVRKQAKLGRKKKKKKRKLPNVLGLKHYRFNCHSAKKQQEIVLSRTMMVLCSILLAK